MSHATTGVPSCLEDQLYPGWLFFIPAKLPPRPPGFRTHSSHRAVGLKIRFLPFSIDHSASTRPNSMSLFM